MSRVGNRVLQIPAGVEVNIQNSLVTIKGKLGTLSREFSNFISIEKTESTLLTKRSSEEKSIKQLHGTTNSLLQGMLTGVSQGFVKELEIKGVGYRATLKDKVLELALGYSHPVLVEIPQDLTLEVPKPTVVIIKGIDKQRVGELAAQIRKKRKPNPYSGKGVAYKDEVIRRKEGKKASK
ncbi:50S ribosomal protein L6 [Mycoplasma sp. 1654_15]|uniref:50S ribosomal protein L6 n=1 Tax=Mycoplasma sp. 1654_15 TaxID=2725994 RepID=UPI001449CC4A|nr:50S ribosomal protein L6 [Mycoplasma sp. 1654_15]QJB71217.1 50S ribosomal protein L6 [Mycoplasma sp. 1654_15]